MDLHGWIIGAGDGNGHGGRAVRVRWRTDAGARRPYNGGDIHNTGSEYPMHTFRKQMSIALLVAAAFGLATGATGARAQVAGSTVIGITVTEAAQVAMGWSAKKSILGKNVYSSKGEKIGKVEDLIIAPDRNVSYLIVSAGGFIGIGSHDVAIPAQQVKEEGGRIVIPGATKDNVKAMPPFRYAAVTSERDVFIDRADKDILVAKERLSSLQAQAAGAAADVKGKLDGQVAALQTNLKSAEARLGAMKKATAKRWKEFENDVNVAMARLRASAGL
jgi:sporulation protein YlmC with PRC-barrel domain